MADADLGSKLKGPRLDPFQEGRAADERPRGLGFLRPDRPELGSVGLDGLDLPGVLGGDVDDERGAEVEAGGVIDELEGPHRRLAGLDLLQAGQEDGLPHQLGRLLMVGMAVDPIRGEDEPGLVEADALDDLQLVLPAHLHPGVRDVQHVVGGQAEDRRGGVEFAGPVGGAAPRSHLAPGQGHDPRAPARGGHLDQRAAATQLGVVGVGSESQGVQFHGGLL